MRTITFGLDISDHSIELVSLTRRQQAIAAEYCVRTEVPAGVITRGVIQDAEKLALILENLLNNVFGEKHGRLQAGVSVAESLAYAKTFVLPANLTPELARKAAEIEAASFFPFSLAEVAADTVRLPSGPDTQVLYYVAADREILESYRDILEHVGVTPLFFECESLALARALVPGRETEPILLADIGARTTALSVLDQGGIRFSSSVSLGGDNLTAALEVQLNTPLEKAEYLKRREGFDQATNHARTLFIIQKPMSEIIEEITRTVDYYQRQTGRSIAKLVLAGGTSLLPAAVDYVASNFSKLQVAKGDPFVGIAIDHLARAEDFKSISLLYATATGLALRASGLRGGPGVDLTPGRSGPGRGEAFFGSFRQAGNKLISMVKRATTPRKKKTAVAAATERQSAAAPIASPSPAPVIETPASVSAPSEPSKLIESPKVEVSAPAAPVKPESVMIEPPEAISAAEEADYGSGIGEILDSAHDYGDKKPVAPPPEEYVGQLPSSGKPKLSIESILSQRNQKAVEPVEAPQPVEPVRERSRSKPRLLPLIILVLICIFVAAAGVFMFAQKSGLGVSRDWLAGITAMFKKSDSTLPAAVPEVPKAPATVNLMVLLGLKEQPSGEMPFVVTRAIENDVTASDTFDATGTAPVGTPGRAEGKLTIINKTAQSYTFVATTRCLSKDGILFRLKKATLIPANGSVEAEVAADKTGAAGDIGPTTFTIPGMGPEMESLIYAESKTAMAGGSGAAGKAVTEGDIAAAKEALVAKLATEAQETLKSMALPDEVLLADLISSNEISVTAPKVGLAANTFEVKLAVRFRAILVPRPAIDALLLKQLTAELPAGLKTVDYSLGEAQYLVEAFDTEADLVQLRVEAAVKKN
ncbi:MAG: pilus assembly protein PilM [Patescibacteria group bacterium]|jgi:type IV pilus assembly protein PilM